MLLNFILVMTHFPDVQRKAHAEVDGVTAGMRLPNFNDRLRMQYCERLFRELHRWQAMDPIGLPHKTTADDVVNGYFVPKGTIVFSNVWFMGHDESVYKDPMQFDPDRYVGDAPEPLLDMFGHGKRYVGRRDLCCLVDADM